MAHDPGHRAQRDDVVDERGPAEEPGHGRQRRLRPDLPASAFEALEHRGLLATDVRARPHEELDIEVGEGSLFGEIGIFSDSKVRTATAKSLGPCSLLVVSAEKVRELFFQNPEFGFFLVGLITRRLSEDAAAGTLKL